LTVAALMQSTCITRGPTFAPLGLPATPTGALAPIPGQPAHDYPTTGSRRSAGAEAIRAASTSLTSSVATP
jgi:hypothetical protein